MIFIKVDLYRKPTRLKCILGSISNKNKPSELRSNLCKATGLGEGQRLMCNFSRSGCGGKLFVSSWFLERVGKGVVRSGENDKVAWLCLNSREKGFGDLLNHVSL